MNELHAERDGTRGKRASLIGLALNFILAAAKIAAGAVTGLVSVIADGINHVSDCGSSLVSFVSFRIAAKPADREHPYGHRRAEYVASMIIAFFVLVLAAELVRESIETLVAGAATEGAWWLYLLFGLSIAVKGCMFFWYRVVAAKTKSDVLRAASIDSACDCLSSLAVVVGMAISQATSFPADGAAGIAVALFIAWQGIGILREAGSKLLGQAPDPALVARIRSIILEGEGVLGIHDLRVYRLGKEECVATVHIEADASVPAALSHARLDAVERRVGEETGVQLTAHLDPVDLSDEEALELEARVRAAAEGMYEGLELHDFRLVRGAGKKLVFEAGVPFDCKATDGQIADDLMRAVRLVSDCEPVVTVERE